MGTGGGELLSEIRHTLPSQVVATEEWRINAPIAKKRLAALGVDVIRCRSLMLPINNSTFDLVINRHEELEPSEVSRILSPHGRVITQQVGGNNWKELRKHFARMTSFSDLRSRYARGFEAAGLRIMRDLQHDYTVAYATLGEFVYMLGVSPWTIPGFDLEHDIDSLLSFDAECRTEDGLVLTESRFLLVAEKPNDLMNQTQTINHERNIQSDYHNS